LGHVVEKDFSISSRKGKKWIEMKRDEIAKAWSEGFEKNVLR
jgi:hypothetical protein